MNLARKQWVTNVISNVISTGIGSAAGGATGSNAASTMDRYNRQIHKQELEWIKDNAAEFLRQQCEGTTECNMSAMDATRILMQQALMQVDFMWLFLLSESGVEHNEAASAFLRGNKETFAIGSTKHTHNAYEAFGAEYFDYTINMDVAFNNRDIYALAGNSVDASKVNLGRLIGYVTLFSALGYDANRDNPAEYAKELFMGFAQTIADGQCQQDPLCPAALKNEITDRQVLQGEALFGGIGGIYNRATLSDSELRQLADLYNYYNFDSAQIGESLGYVVNALMAAAGGGALNRIFGGKTVKAVSGSKISNDILDNPRVGSGEKDLGSGNKVDQLPNKRVLDKDGNPITVDPNKAGPVAVQELPSVPRGHGFTDIVDNYASKAVQTT